MDLLTACVESLDDPQWFLVFVRPAGYPEGAPPGHPQLPFCIVAVATFAETEAIFYNHVRRLQSYQDAFGLLPHPRSMKPLASRWGTSRAACRNVSCRSHACARAGSFSGTPSTASDCMTWLTCFHECMSCMPVRLV